MTAHTGRRPEKPKGPKRDADRTNAILQAAAELLFDLGYDKLRIQDVANRAGSGTGAIYRRWATKEALVAEAIKAMPQAEVEISDDPIADLDTLVGYYCHTAADKPDLLPGLIAAIRSEPGIKDAVSDGPTLEPLRNAIARIIGPDHPQLQLLTELAPATALHRSALTPETYAPQATTDEIMALIQFIADHGRPGPAANPTEPTRE